MSVRDNDGSLIQLFYGEDGVDTTKTKYLEKFNFLASNSKHFTNQYRIGAMKNHFNTIDGSTLEL